MMGVSEPLIARGHQLITIGANQVLLKAMKMLLLVIPPPLQLLFLPTLLLQPRIKVNLLHQILPLNQPLLNQLLSLVF